MEDKKYVDLHIHSSYSDGVFSPEEIVRYAESVGLVAISIADHDITDGILPALKEAAKVGIEVIPAVELSVELKESAEGEMHIVGYFINWEDQKFQEQLRLFRQARERRAYHILDKLYKLGIKIDESDLFKVAGLGTIGRLHFARVMLKEGYVKSIREAFEKYLSFGRPAFVPKLRLKPDEAIKMILQIGGIPVLAHPYYGKYDDRRLMRRLMKYGLMGIEVWHSKHPPDVVERFLRICNELKLLVVGGSDCHGVLENSQPLIGSQKVPIEILYEMKKMKSKLNMLSREILK